MKKTVLRYLFALSLTMCVMTGFGQSKSGKWVDPFIGTAGDHGQLDPAAGLPFGLVRLGPDTDPINHSGYDYTAQKIKGFSHVRIAGTGCTGAGGNILIKPGVGLPNTLSVAYDKAAEKASPGYYEVSVCKPAIAVRLTATNFVGFHHYTFPKSDSAYLMVNLKAAFADFIGEEHLINGNGISGWVSAKNVCNFGAYKLYYNIVINQNFEVKKDSGGILFLNFNTQKNQDIKVVVGLSPVDVTEAKANTDAIVKSMDFDKIRNNAAHVWEQKLSKVYVEGNPEFKKIFYTHLYHAYLAPFNITGRRGIYNGADGKKYHATNHTQYAGWSMWDSYRTQFPLLTLTEPALMRDIAVSLTNLYKEGKADWSTNTEPAPTVRTEFAHLVLLDAYKKGIKGFDLETVYPLIKEETNTYSYKTPDKKLEASYANWGVAQIAKVLNKAEDFKSFLQKSEAYRQIWDEKFKPITPKSDVMHGDGLYEGTLWQYRWFVPHDIGGVVDMLGSKEEFANQLAFFFENNLYNHGNQPDINAPYLFNFVGKPWLTQKYVNQILAKDIIQHYGTHHKWKQPYKGRIYKSTPDGYIPEMDDDVGTMSSWYVLGAMGIYPAVVGEPIYLITSPLFERVELHFDRGKKFIVQAKGISDSNFYIQSAKLNGKSLNRCWLKHDEIVKGGKLVFEMGSEPNKQWGLSEPYMPKLK